MWMEQDGNGRKALVREKVREEATNIPAR